MCARCSCSGRVAGFGRCRVSSAALRPGGTDWGWEDMLAQPLPLQAGGWCGTSTDAGHYWLLPLARNLRRNKEAYFYTWTTPVEMHWIPSYLKRAMHKMLCHMFSCCLETGWCFLDGTSTVVRDQSTRLSAPDIRMSSPPCHSCSPRPPIACSRRVRLAAPARLKRSFTAYWMTHCTDTELSHTDTSYTEQGAAAPKTLNIKAHLQLECPI